MATTELHPWHTHNNGKMIDFSGWDMPLHYGSQIEEHHVVRNKAGIFDVSHMGVVDIHGQQATAFLRYLLANDVAKLSSDMRALYTCMLNHDGGVIDDLIVYRINANQYRLIINASRREVDTAWLTEQAQPFTATLTPRPSLCIIAIQGPQALSLCAPILGEQITNLKPFHCIESGNFFIARTGYTGEDGVEVLVDKTHALELWQQCIDAGIQACGLGARDTLRLEAGLNLYGNDMDETTSPYHANLGWTVSLKDETRDFIGKAALLKHKASHSSKLVGIVMTAPGVLRDHQDISIRDNGTATITSGSYSPTLGHSIAFARIPIDTQAEQLYIDRRGKEIPLQIIKPPFVKKGLKNF